MILFLACAVIGLMAVLAVVLRAYDRLLRDSQRQKEDRETWEARARHKAVVIVEEARDKALEILREARIEAETKRDSLNKKLDNLGERQLIDYKNVLQTISKAVEEGATRELGQFRQALESETIQAQKVIGEKMEDQYNRMADEIKHEKQIRLEELDKQVFAVIKKATNDIIGKALTVDEHSDLVIKALEEAKRTHVL